MKCVSQIIMMIIISPEFLPPAPEDYDLAARGWFGRHPIRENPAKLKLPFGSIYFSFSTF